MIKTIVVGTALLAGCFFVGYALGVYALEKGYKEGKDAGYTEAKYYELLRILEKKED